MINLHESMGPDRDRTRDPWICNQTRICSQTRYRLRNAARLYYQFGEIISIVLWQDIEWKQNNDVRKEWWHDRKTEWQLQFWIFFKRLPSTSWVGISGTATKSHKRKFVPSSHPGPFTEKTNKGRYSRLFLFFEQERDNYVKIRQCYSM